MLSLLLWSIRPTKATNQEMQSELSSYSDFETKNKSNARHTNFPLNLLQNKTYDPYQGILKCMEEVCKHLDRKFLFWHLLKYLMQSKVHHLCSNHSGHIHCQKNLNIQSGITKLSLYPPYPNDSNKLIIQTTFANTKL